MAFPDRGTKADRGTTGAGNCWSPAAAGSGKTRVLVGAAHGPGDPGGMDLDQFLVITHTKAAAGELRARIAQELSARLAEAPQRPAPSRSADRPGLSGSDLHHPRLLRRPPSGRAGTCWIWTRTSACATRGGPCDDGPGAGGRAGGAVPGHRSGGDFRPAGGYPLRRTG